MSGRKKSKNGERANKKNLHERRLVGEQAETGQGLLSSEDSTLEREVLKAEYLQSIPMATKGLGAGEEMEVGGERFYALMRVVRNTLMKESLQTNTINRILGEVIAGAYQDRVVAYTMACKDANPETIRRIQQTRQSADKHLLYVIQAFRDFKRPPVNVVVKQAGQVNVADKQVNLAQNKECPK